MESKVKALVDDKIKDLGLFVSSVYYSTEEGVKTLNIELDSEEIIDVNKITEATKIINPIMDENNLCDDIDVLDIHSKEKEMCKMDGKEFLKAVDLVVKEKHIDKEIIFEAMRNALTSAYKKNAKSKNNNVKVLINENNGDIKVYSYLTVVPDDKMTKEEYEDALFERYAEDDDLDTEISEKEFKEEEKS